MPINPVPQHVPAYPYQINIPADDDGYFITIQIQGDGTPTTPQLDAMTQNLIDYMQEWPGRDPQANVTGIKYDLQYFDVQPTDPIAPPPPPPPEP